MYYDCNGRLICLLMMPRVVPDQRRKFDTEEPFLSLCRPGEVRYTGLPLGTDDERRARFQQDCRDGRIEIACIPNGMNLELYVAPSSSQAPVPEDQASLSRDYIEFASDPAKAQISCHFILNGVCVRWRGGMDSNTLRGHGCLEFDEEGARMEDQRLRQELRGIQERLRYLEHHQPFLRGLAIPPIPTTLPVSTHPSSTSTFPSNHRGPLPPPASSSSPDSS